MYRGLACDGDGTLTRIGKLAQATRQALERWKRSGRALLLVTGEPLEQVVGFPHVGLFDRVVAENGAVLYHPPTGKHRCLVNPPPRRLLRSLRQRGIEPLNRGCVIVSTQRSQAGELQTAIDECGLSWHLLFNRDDVMALPAGTGKASGLATALTEMGLSASEVVGIGDAQNDCQLLTLCGCGVAVANALPRLKECADMITAGGPGRGVREVIRWLLEDAAEIDVPQSRRDV